MVVVSSSALRERLLRLCIYNINKLLWALLLALRPLWWWWFGAMRAPNTSQHHLKCSKNQSIWSARAHARAWLSMFVKMAPFIALMGQLINYCIKWFTSITTAQAARPQTIETIPRCDWLERHTQAQAHLLARLWSIRQRVWSSRSRKHMLDIDDEHRSKVTAVAASGKAQLIKSTPRTECH